jgi:hypothetical protein
MLFPVFLAVHLKLQGLRPAPALQSWLYEFVDMHHSSAIDRCDARRFSPTILHSLKRPGGYLGIVFHQKKLQVCWNDLSLIDQKAVIANNSRRRKSRLRIQLAIWHGGAELSQGIGFKKR